MKRRFRPVLQAALAVAATACSVQDSAGDDELAAFLSMGPEFVDSAPLRRAALEASLVDPDNGYSRLRLAEYGRGGTGWDALAEFTPEVRRVTKADFGTLEAAGFSPTPGVFVPTAVPADFGWTHAETLALGRQAFFTYPAMLDGTLSAALESAQTAADLGLQVDADGTVVGIVRTRLESGEEWSALACAACHASIDGATVVAGRTNRDFDKDGITRRFHGLPGSGWGAGQVDVTADGIENPAAIIDLRAVRHQERLHWAATLYNSPAALAVRVDTLLITSLGESVRPPREISFALAYYLWSLGEAEVVADDALAGSEVFATHCSACHGADGSSIGAVEMEVVGTAPEVGSSPMRGTGYYRVPSLHKVGDRTQLLHTGAVETLEELLSSDRLAEVPGHEYGVDLSTEDREALIEYLRTI